MLGFLFIGLRLALGLDVFGLGLRVVANWAIGSGFSVCGLNMLV